jgi:hypothetical protein
MGVFKQSMDFVICNGILTVPLAIKAASHLPKSADNVKSPGVRLPAIKSAESGTKKTAGELFQTYAIDIDPNDMDAAERRKQHMKQYVEFLRASHATRIQKNQFTKSIEPGKVEPEAVSNGDGPHLPKIVDSYFTQYKQILDKVKVKKQKLDDMTLDENHFIKKKFKSKPSSQSEVRECKAKLSRADLFQNVTAGNKMFDFGIYASSM